MATSMATFNWDQLPVTTASTANPAAGANPALVTVPAGKRWLLVGAYTTITTAVAAADRYPLLYADNGTVAIVQVMSPTPITASITAQACNFVPGAAAAAVIMNSGCLTVGIRTPGIELAAGYRFQIQFLNIQGADDATAMNYVYKEVPA